MPLTSSPLVLILLSYLSLFATQCASSGNAASPTPTHTNPSPQPPLAPICLFSLESDYIGGLGESSSDSDYGQSLTFSMVLDREWAGVCRPELRATMEESCPLLDFTWRQDPFANSAGHCVLDFYVMQKGLTRFEPLLHRWDLDLSRVGCLFWVLKCVASERGFVPVKGCVSIFICGAVLAMGLTVSSSSCLPARGRAGLSMCIGGRNKFDIRSLRLKDDKEQP